MPHHGPSDAAPAVASEDERLGDPMARPARLFPLLDMLRGSAGRASAVIGARPVLTRCLLAGPGAVLLGLATMAAMPLWLPAGRAGVNGVAFPILLTPLLWAVPFFYACLEENLPRGVAMIVLPTLGQGVAVALALS
jgi:hypothetical protein